MEKIAVFVNDAAHASRMLRPMLISGAPVHWIVIACPPTLTRHIGRWVSQASRRAWRERWAGALLAELMPELGSRVDTRIASRPLAEISARLQAGQPGLRLLDARRPTLGRIDEPISATQPAVDGQGRAGSVAAAMSLTAVLALAD